MICSCGRIKIGLQITENRNWNPDCAEHGVKSDWYRSPEQTAKRDAQNERLRDLQRQAREARRANNDHSTLQSGAVTGTLES